MNLFSFSCWDLAQLLGELHEIICLSSCLAVFLGYRSLSLIKSISSLQLQIALILVFLKCFKPHVFSHDLDKSYFGYSTIIYIVLIFSLQMQYFQYRAK
jgi:hypothetical protein